MRANDKITTTTRWTAHIGCALLASVALASAAQAGQFGTRCQESFEDDWQSNARWGYEICGGFNGELDDSDTRDFYYNLHPSTCGFSYCDSSSALGGVDTVDLFYVATHGGTDASDALLAMWQEDSIERSSDWRYGDDNDEVGIYSQYACEVMENTDSAIWTRWGSAFRGGVYIVTGSHDKVYGSITTDEVGRDYADSLQKSKSVRRAWFDGNSDWFHDQDLAVMAVGSSSTNCTNRLNGIKWQNFTSYARLRDSEITHWCRSRITG